jgi:hypothetical protein
LRPLFFFCGQSAQPRASRLANPVKKKPSDSYSVLV